MKLSLGLGFVTTLLLSVSVRSAELNVFAAASLADALTAVAKIHESEGGDKLRFNFAASSTLARQIEEGAPADLFFSADEAKMDHLAKAGLVAVDTRVSLLSNTLVIVVGADDGARINAPADLAESEVRRIALAEPATVPAGIYAKEFLVKSGLWKRIADKVVPTENVRACLAVVASGNADAGIVYKTDALISRRVKIACEISVADGPAISYPLAVMKESKNGEAARKFAVFLGSPRARAIFVEYGFLPVR